jgi:uncharacterized membrane protein (DUF485 family)
VAEGHECPAHTPDLRSVHRQIEDKLHFIAVWNRRQSKSAPIFLVGPFLCGLVTTETSAPPLQVLGIKSYGNAIAFGAVVGFGYLASRTVNTGIYPNIPRPLLYGLSSRSFFVVVSIIISVILVAMG